MGTPAVRYLDSAVGIVVLLLLAIAVVGGQATSNSIPDAAPGASMGALYPRVGTEVSESGEPWTGLSQRIANAELALPAVDFARELRLRETYDDRPALHDD